MSDRSFGFGPSDRDKDPDRENKPDDGQGSGSGSGSGGEPADGPKDPFGFGGGGPSGFGGAFPGMPAGFTLPGMPAGGQFDMNQLGQMLSQLGQMLSQAGSSSGPVNYDLAKQIAIGQLGASSQPTSEQRGAVSESFRLAELWLDPATTLPAGANTVESWSPKDWVNKSMQTWQRLCDPIAQRVSTAWVEGLPEEARQAAGPMLAMLGQMGGVTFGSQLGAGIAQLAPEMLTSTDVGIPLAPAGTAALLPAAVERFTAGLDRPASEVMVYLAVREAAHHRLFNHAPWLPARLIGAIEDYARSIRVDTDRIEEIAREIDPANPQSLENALQSGLFEPPKTPEQFTALARIEVTLALIEGWVEVVVTDAVGDRLPGANALRETFRRRRASGGPAEQTFATLVGLELRPRQLHAASRLWRRLTDEHGIDRRDSVWAHPDLMPTEQDLEDPASFTPPGLDDSIDPIAELQRTEQSESSKQAEQAEQERARGGDFDGGKTEGDASKDTDHTDPPEDSPPAG